jgi:hypothetical protein
MEHDGIALAPCVVQSLLPDLPRLHLERDGNDRPLLFQAPPQRLPPKLALDTLYQQ